MESGDLLGNICVWICTALVVGVLLVILVYLSLVAMLFIGIGLTSSGS